jgi:polyisoprenyl-teichoic acid--peptidoglycan teichoic acid transferase
VALDAEVVARPPRRWPRRLLIGLNIFVALCLFATATGYLYYRHEFGKISTVNVCKALRRCGDDQSGQPMNVLLVGSDTRSTLSKADQKRYGNAADVSGQRSDTILILHIDPKVKKASILSIPRDLYVPIAGTTRQAKINSAFTNGPEQLIETIHDAFGIQIDHYAEVDFEGFRGIVNAIAPVYVYFPAPARDDLSGLHQKIAGCIPLWGDSALAYVRSRHYELYENGRWRPDPTGDLGRIQRQQDFIRRVMKTAIKKGATNPITLARLIDRGVQSLTIDKSFSSGDILRVGKRFKSLDPNQVEMLTLPTVPGSVGGESILRLQQPDAQEVIDRFNGVARQTSDTLPGDVPNIPPGSIRVRVLNGTGVSGQASSVAADLSKQGFGTAGTGQADSYRYISPVIRYGRGQRDKALVLKAYVGTAELREDLSIQGVDLVFITGSGFDGVRNPNPSAASSTTTAPPKTTTTIPNKATPTSPPPPTPASQC